MTFLSIGTRSVLFGAHCFFIHPWFVAAAWWQLYGFPWDPRLWVAFVVHDLGYWGKPNMDGPEGEAHVLFGANLMHRLFDGYVSTFSYTFSASGNERYRSTRWRDLCQYHSRFWAKQHGVQPSKLCAADKLAVALEPWWLYLPRVMLSGEIHEYMAASRSAALGRDQLAPNKYSGEPSCTDAVDVAGLPPRRAWHKVMTTYCRQWAMTHADGRQDQWTSPAPPVPPTLTCGECRKPFKGQGSRADVIHAASQDGWSFIADADGERQYCPSCYDPLAFTPALRPVPRSVPFTLVCEWRCPECGTVNLEHLRAIPPSPGDLTHGTPSEITHFPSEVKCPECASRFTSYTHNRVLVCQ